MEKSKTDPIKAEIKLISELGLNSLLVIKTNGIPIYKFHFNQNSLMKTDSILLGSFFSAINAFSNSFLRMISDIIFVSDDELKSQEILFFKYYNNLIYIISLSVNNKFIEISNISLREKIEMILWQFAGEFYDIFISIHERNELIDLNNAFTNYEALFIDLICRGCIDLGQNLPLMNLPSENKIDISIEDIKSMSIKQIVSNLGLESIFILKNIDGELIMEKYFHKKENKISGMSISNYFMAIDSFASNYILKNLLNFGFFFNRLYFDKFLILDEEYIMLYIFNDVLYCYNSIKEVNVIVNGIKTKIRKILQSNSRPLSIKQIAKYFDLRRTSRRKNYPRI